VTVFDTIYRENRWNGVESRSGPGSGPAATEQVARELVALVAELGVESVLDVGCGDSFWMPDMSGYVGIDVTMEAIRRAQANHPDRDYRLAGVRDVAQEFDLVICRDVIQHCSYRQGLDLLGAIRDAGAPWLLASTYVGGENIDIETGDSFSPDLTKHPYWMGQPQRLIFDGWTYHDASAVRDPRKFLGLWALTNGDRKDHDD
jgi:SAM-dependent methyltransferase